MPKVTDEYRTARRDQIAHAALTVIRRKGFQAASMADIIAESGLSAGAIYGHYKSKADIVLDVARRVVGDRVVDIRQLADAPRLIPPPAVLRRVIGAVTEALGDPTVVVQLWGAAVVEPQLRELVSEVFARIKGAMGAYLTRWYEREHGLSPREAEATAEDVVPLYVSGVVGYLLQGSLLPSFDAETYLDMLERRLPH